jgi:hypothetical protein
MMFEEAPEGDERLQAVHGLRTEVRSYGATQH